MNTFRPITVSILEDHQGIIDGYLFRLQGDSSFKISGIAHYGNELETMLAKFHPDLLILDINVPVSGLNPVYFPIMQVVPRIKQLYPAMKLLVISSHDEIVLIEKLVDLGIHGYIYKSDFASIQRLAEILPEIRQGENFFSETIGEKLAAIKRPHTNELHLSERQFKALTLCAAFPDENSDDLAARMDIAPVTFRNLLSRAYRRLGVHTRSAALACLQNPNLRIRRDLSD